MADVTIKYNGSSVAEINGTGSKTLKTSGKYCEGDIFIDYVAKEAGLANGKRWDITLTAGLPSSGYNLTLVTDNWLKENRANPNLCVVVMPKFTIKGDTHIQGVFLNTNMPLMQVQEVDQYSLSAYKHSNNNISARMRKYKLTNANDMGDLGINTSGTLYAVAYGDYDFAVGDYVIFAFIV